MTVTACILTQIVRPAQSDCDALSMLSSHDERTAGTRASGTSRRLADAEWVVEQRRVDDRTSVIEVNVTRVMVTSTMRAHRHFHN